MELLTISPEYNVWYTNVVRSSPLIDDARLMIDESRSSKVSFDTKSCVPTWRIKCSGRFLKGLKNAYYPLFNQDLLFLTISSRSHVLLSSHLKVKPFFCSSFQVVFFFMHISYFFRTSTFSCPFLYSFGWLYPSIFLFH